MISVEQLALYNHQLSKHLSGIFGESLPQFLTAPAEKPGLRLNPLKAEPGQFLKRLADWKVNFSPLPFSALGYSLDEDLLPLSHTIDYIRGNFFYQGIASQIPVIVLDPQPGQTVLDMAAAPGSKSTQIAALMQGRGKLVLNEFARSRLQPLNTNWQRSGASNALHYHMDGQALGIRFPNYFDKVLLDAPCTALGTLAGSSEILNWWSDERLRKLVNVQQALLVSAVKACRPGGEIVYSTCSLSPEENEFQIQWLTEHYPVEILPVHHPALQNYRNRNLPAGVSPSLEQTLKVLPQVHGLEGFFVARLRKKEPMFQRLDGLDAEQTELNEADHPDLAGPLHELSENWGICRNEWDRWRYLRRRRKLWAFDKSWTQFPQAQFTNGGILLAEQGRYMRWRLSTPSFQLSDLAAAGPVLEPDEEMLTRLFAEHAIQTSLSEGYYGLIYKYQKISIVYADEQGKLRINLPHSFRLVL